MKEIFPNSVSTDLPVIQIKQSPIKLLIDTSSINSILNPTIAETYFRATIYHFRKTIKRAIGESETSYKADIKAFSEFNTQQIISFV